MVFDLNAKGKSTALFLDQSWQKPKEAVHRYWQEYGAVSAPDLNFFLQSFGGAQQQTPPDVIQHGTVDERLGMVESLDQQDVEAVGDEEESLSEVIADARNHDWPDSYGSIQEEDQRDPNDNKDKGKDNDEDEMRMRMMLMMMRS